jgi:hypothetical protein
VIPVDKTTRLDTGLLSFFTCCCCCCCCCQVTTEAQARAAIAAAKQLRDRFVFIEVVVEQRDAAPGAAALRQGFVGRHFR